MKDDVAVGIEEITRGAGVDRIVEVDLISNLAVSQKAVKQNGVIAIYSSDSNNEPVLPFLSFMFRGVTLQLVFVYVMSAKAHESAVTDITAALRAGALQPFIAERYPLSETIAAHEALKSGRMAGKILLTIA